jgi:hypothetical protein
MVNHSKSAGGEPRPRRLSIAFCTAIAASLAGVSAAVAGSDLPNAPHVQVLVAADKNAKAQSDPSAVALTYPVEQYICTPSGAGRTSTCVRGTGI